MSLHLALRQLALLAGTVALLIYAAPSSAAPVSTFGVTVPKRSGAGQFEISALKITVQLDSSAPIALSVSEGASGTLTTQSMTLTTAANDCFGGTTCFADLPNLPAGATHKDRLVVIKPQQAGADPASAGNNKVVLLLRLRSNLNEAGACVSTMSGNESWTVSVVGGAARITGVSVQSLDRKTSGPGNPQCGTAFRPIPLNDGPVATVSGSATILAGGRVGVDTIMVLDRSGSMSEPVSATPGAPTKMARLGEAAGSFIDMWKALRDNECQNFAVNCPAIGALPGIQAPVDRLGVVFFDDTIRWLKELVPASALDTSGLKDFGSLSVLGGAVPCEGAGSNPNQEKCYISQVGPNGWTSIGGGLVAAAPKLAPAASEPNRKVILLMTDGMQNTDPLAQVVGSQVQTTIGGSPTELPNQAKIQIYGVTVGTATAVDPTINQALANATGGFYLNTEDNAAILPNLFVQVLQNTLKYSTVETLRVLADNTSIAQRFTTVVPVTSSTHSLALNLNWAGPRRSLRVLLTPPGGGNPIVFNAPAGALSLTGRLAFPLPNGRASAGDWQVRIEPADDIQTPVPFHFTLLADDAAINSALGPDRAEVAVGGRVRLTAQINDFDAPLLGLDAQPNAQVQVLMVRPGVNLGDVLSDAPVAPAPAAGADPGSAAQRKLQALLAANPNALVRASDIVTLRDDGSAASGDSQAGDGIYSALVPAEFEGHYQFVFRVEGTSAAGGRFVRQQIRTVHVGSLPDAGATQVSTAVQPGAGTTTSQSVLVVTLTPRNVRGGKMGPGWANYLWLTSAGQAPVKPADNLDGTYTARIGFSGATPPPVALHFLAEPVRRPDSFVPQASELTPANRVLADVSNPTAPRYALWLAGGSTYPHGSFRNQFDRDVAFNAGFEYALSASTAIEATLGLHRFSGKSGAADLDVTQLGVNGKWYFGSQPWRWFALAGAGAYLFDPGSTRLGGYVGLGSQWLLGPQWSIEARYALHGVLNNSPYTSYSTLQLGLRYGF